MVLSPKSEVIGCDSDQSPLSVELYIHFCMLSCCPQGDRNGLGCIFISHSFVMSVCSSAVCMSAAVTGLILMKFETRDLIKNLH